MLLEDLPQFTIQVSLCQLPKPPTPTPTHIRTPIPTPTPDVYAYVPRFLIDTYAHRSPDPNKVTVLFMGGSDGLLVPLSIAFSVAAMVRLTLNRTPQ